MRPLTALNTKEPAKNDTEPGDQAMPACAHLSPLMMLVIVFSAITGLLMGYDLCIVAVTLDSVVTDFDKCEVVSRSARLAGDLDFRNGPFINSQGNYVDFDGVKLRQLSDIDEHLKVLNDPQEMSSVISSEDTSESLNNVMSSSVLIEKSPQIKKLPTVAEVFKRRANSGTACLPGSLCSVSAFHDSAIKYDSARQNLDFDEQIPSSVYGLPQKKIQPDYSRRKLQAKETIQEAFQSCDAKQQFVSIISPGAALGSILAGFVADAAGRKFTLFMSDGLIMLGTLIMALGQSFSLIVGGRFILGLGIGTGFVIFSTYVSEISPPKHRGQLVSCQEVAQCVGCLSAYAAGAIAKGGSQWRAMLLAAGVLASIQTCGILLLPESPRWLVSKNKIGKAQVSLRRLAGLPRKPTLSQQLESTPDIKDDLIISQNLSYKQKKRKAIIEMKEREVAAELNNIVEERQSEDLRVASRTPSKKQQVKKQLEYGEKSLKPEDVYTAHCVDLSSKAPNPSNDNQKIQKHELCHFASKTSTQYDTDIEANDLARTNHAVNTDLDQRNSISFAENSNQKILGCFPHDSVQRLQDLITTCILYWRPLMIAVGCAVCQNLTGSTVILYYSTEILQLAGNDSNFWGIGIGLAKVIGIILVILTVERIGRKRFLMIGSIGTLIGLLGFATSFLLARNATYDTIKDGYTPILCVVSMLFYMFSINISWAGLMFVVASEVLPSSVRGMGMGLTITTFWILAFFSQNTLETLMASITIWGTFILYAFFNVLAILFTYFFIPELSGKSLEEITEQFN